MLREKRTAAIAAAAAAAVVVVAKLKLEKHTFTYSACLARTFLLLGSEISFYLYKAQHPANEMLTKRKKIILYISTKLGAH